MPRKQEIELIEQTGQAAVRELTFKERATWGTCSVCRAGPGEWCDRTQGLAWWGERPKEGVHLARLNAAPRAIKQVPVY